MKEPKIGDTMLVENHPAKVVNITKTSCQSKVIRLTIFLETLRTGKKYKYIWGQKPVRIY